MRVREISSRGISDSFCLFDALGSINVTYDQNEEKYLHKKWRVLSFFFLSQLEV